MFHLLSSTCSLHVKVCQFYIKHSRPFSFLNFSTCSACELFLQTSLALMFSCVVLIQVFRIRSP